MPIHINRLNCRVTIRRTGKRAKLHQDEAPSQPSLSFAMPVMPQRVEGEPSPDEMHSGAQEEAYNPHARQQTPVTARGVADRVYELMTQEIKQAQQRSGRF